MTEHLPAIIRQIGCPGWTITPGDASFICEAADEIERLREALQFIADQKDKTGNWAVELAKRTLAVEAAGGE